MAVCSVGNSIYKYYDGEKTARETLCQSVFQLCAATIPNPWISGLVSGTGEYVLKQAFGFSLWVTSMN